MRGISQATARFWMLMVAAIYIVAVGLVEVGESAGAFDSITADDAVRTATTLASMTVGAIIGFYLASRPRQSGPDRHSG